jgi:UDP-glucose 4-epimerase
MNNLCVRIHEMTLNKKTVVVTGGAGFVGSHLCERLLRDGCRVISIDNYFTGKEENHIEGVEYINGHTKDIEKILKVRPDLIFHLGEYARVEKSFDDTELIYDLNIAGTFAVLEFAKKNNTKMVYAGSSTKFAEGGLGRHQSPYAWSKATNTDLVKNYGTWFGLQYAVTYFYNVYGPREISSGPYATILGIFRTAHIKGKPLTVVSPGTQRRNFTHVLDIVDGLVLVGEHGEGDGYGLGASESYSIIDLAKMFGGEIEMLPERKGNRFDSPLEIEKATKLGWNAHRRLEDYINEIRQKQN